MKITVVGLGLIGGSFCKTIKKHTNHTCLGFDLNKSVLDSALRDGAIDGIAADFSEADLTVVCLYPEATIDFLVNNADKFRNGSIVIDACGIKSAVVEAAVPALEKHGVFFVGAHPMAGREFSGFAYSLDNLYDNASFILAPTENIPEEIIGKVSDFAKELHFRKIVRTTHEHDRIIAYTSQLAHVVSGAYIKSPSLNNEMGFSAGSFKDLTRVARLNEDMWTSLFLMNREPLLFEIDEIISHLQDFRNALGNSDAEQLHELLKESRVLKEKSDELNRG